MSDAQATLPTEACRPLWTSRGPYTQVWPMTDIPGLNPAQAAAGATQKAGLLGHTSPRRLPALSVFGPYALEKTPLSPAPEDGACWADRQNGWGSPKGPDSGRGHQERAHFPLGSWSPASRILPEAASGCKGQHGVSSVCRPPVSQGSIASSEGPGALGILPAQAGPGHQLPGPPKPRSRSYRDTRKATVLGSIAVSKRLQSPHPAARP